jgi:hypothetical protein
MYLNLNLSVLTILFNAGLPVSGKKAVLLQKPINLLTNNLSTMKAKLQSIETG